MPIAKHPAQGMLLICDFDQGFKVPEMVKRRPVVVIAPAITVRNGLTTVVALSTTEPVPKMGYHCEIELPCPLPEPFHAPKMWVKGDMVVSVGSHRLDLIRIGRDKKGGREYLMEPLPDETIKRIQNCVLRGLGLSALDKTPLTDGCLNVRRSPLNGSASKTPPGAAMQLGDDKPLCGVVSGPGESRALVIITTVLGPVAPNVFSSSTNSICPARQ